jgi:hypothetical protein
VDSQGDSYYVAPNPPYGATFTYYLAEEIKSLKDQRAASEKESSARNEDVAFPEWDRIGMEQGEDAPAIVFTVSDQHGNVIRHIEAPAAAGFQRVSWNLRYPIVDPWVPEEERDSNRRAAGVLAAPGTYIVSMHQRVDGELVNLNQTQTFDVVSIREPTLPGSSQERRIAFSRQVDEMRRAASGTIKSVDEVLLQLDAIKEALQNATADMNLYDSANSIQQQLKQQRILLAGDDTRSSFGAPGAVPVTGRLAHAAYNPNANAYGPTQTQSNSLQIAQTVYAEISTELTRLIDQEYSQLRGALDAAGVPWTPGRGVLTPN